MSYVFVMLVSLADRHKTFQLLEPVLHEDHFGQGLRLSVSELDHQESPSVRRDVPGTDRVAVRVSRLFKQEAWLADEKTGPSSNINDPDLLFPAIE